MAGTITESATQPEVGDSSTRLEPASPEVEPSRTTGEEWKLRGWRWWLASALVLTLALAALVPTTGDFGLTWDEPAYRYSQIISAQWWEQLWHARSWNEIRALLEPDALLYYWPYARSGINFHPPLAGQLNLATHALFGSWMKDIPSRRMASVIEFALTITIGFGFLARRYGAWVGLIMAGSLLFMPRLYGQAHLAETDIPGLFLWAATALAFWNGLHQEHGRPCACSWGCFWVWLSWRRWLRSASWFPCWSGWSPGIFLDHLTARAHGPTGSMAS